MNHFIIFAAPPSPAVIAPPNHSQVTGFQRFRFTYCSTIFGPLTKFLFAHGLVSYNFNYLLI